MPVFADVDLFGEMLKASPGLVAEFDKCYQAPAIEHLVCRKCGARVDNRIQHLAWHKELSLRMFAANWLLRELARSVGFIDPPPILDLEEETQS